MVTLSSTITFEQMKTIEIKGSFRKELGKKNSKQIRKEGNVPCVIYGKEKNIHFSAHENSFKNLIYTHEAHLVKLNLDGQEYNAVLQDMQFHPVTDRILHADFVQIFDNKPVIINIPVTVTGDSVGVKAGGKLIVKRRHLKVKGLAKDLPEDLTVDVTDLKIHHSIKVGDLSFDKIELLDPKITTVVSVATSRVALKTEEEVAAEAAAAAAAAEGAEAAAETPADEKGKEREKGKKKRRRRRKIRKVNSLNISGTMKYLIVGLGNIGEEYTDTRHNIGFTVLDAMAKASNTSFTDKRYGSVCSVKIKGNEFILLKPSTFMNLSGNAVRYWLNKEKIPARKPACYC